MALRPQEVVPADAACRRTGMPTIDYAFVSGESTPTRAAQVRQVRAGGRVAGRTTVRLVVSREVRRAG